MLSLNSVVIDNSNQKCNQPSDKLVIILVEEQSRDSEFLLVHKKYQTQISKNKI